MRQFGPMRSHEIGGLYGAQCNHVFVGAAIAHDAHAFDGEEDSEGLRGEVVPTFAIRVFCGAQFLDKNGIRAPQ